LHQSLIPSFLRIHTAHDETQARSDLDNNRRALVMTKRPTAVPSPSWLFQIAPYKYSSCVWNATSLSATE
jgi:hypothetical protein